MILEIPAKNYKKFINNISLRNQIIKMIPSEKIKNKANIKLRVKFIKTK